MDSIRRESHAATQDVFQQVLTQNFDIKITWLSSVIYINMFLT